jgi:hypothetical protein
VLTGFTIPRAFTGDVARRQLNALRAFRALGIDVIVFGDEEGVGAAAAAEGARQVPEIGRTELGTPLVSDAFAAARELASTPLLLYANADLVFLPGLREAAARIGRPRFLGVGRRVDLELDGELSFEPGWDDRLRKEVGRRGELDSPWAIDWFLFPRELDLGLPPFAVGRPGWDNWLIARTRSLGLPVVDLTEAVTVVHQRHGYEHVPGSTVRWEEGPEAEANRSLAAGTEGLGILDATHVLGPRGLRRALAPRYLRARLVRERRRGSPAGRLLDRVAQLLR